MLENSLLVKNPNCQIPKRRPKIRKDTWTYDEEGRLTGLQVSTRKSILGDAWSYQYDEAGRLIKQVFHDRLAGNDIVAYDYGSRGEITQIRFYTSDGKILKETATFEYNMQGNVQRWFLVKNDFGRKFRFDLEYEYYD
jgi:YD repeat-containing protein